MPLLKSGQSATKLRTGESSTTIPPEGSTRQAIGRGYGQTLTCRDEGQDIVCALVKTKEVHKRTALGVASFREQQPPKLRLKKNYSSYICYLKKWKKLNKYVNFSATYVTIIMR